MKILKNKQVVGTDDPTLFWNLNYFSKGFLSAHTLKKRGRPKGSKNKEKNRA